MWSGTVASSPNLRKIPSLPPLVSPSQGLSLSPWSKHIASNSIKSRKTTRINSNTMKARSKILNNNSLTKTI